MTNINDPPDCSLAVPSSANLWPPNHKMKQITIDGVTDAADAYPTFTITVTGVTQDEPLDGTGDGDTSPDAVVQAGAAAGGTADAVLIRAERAGGSPHDGRVYVISFVADDGFESCTGSVAVGVPHNKKDTPVDSGQTVNSEGP